VEDQKTGIQVRAARQNTRFLIFSCVLKVGTLNQKTPALSHRGLGCSAHHRNVDGLPALRAFFDREFDFLAFHQVAEPVTLDGREVDENVLSAVAGDETITFFTIKPFNRTIDSVRHCVPPLGNKKNSGILFVPSEGQNKTTHGSNRELPLFIQPT
jgi:hypothetical protein